MEIIDKSKVESRKSKVESRKSKVESRKSKVESRKSKEPRHLREVEEILILCGVIYCFG